MGEANVEQHIIADKTLIRTAQITSWILTPFSIPFLAFLVLFLFSYLRIMPLQYKLIVLGIVYCFTILMPTITIFLFRKINGFALQELSERKKRYIPFTLTITRQPPPSSCCTRCARPECGYRMRASAHGARRRLRCRSCRP